MLQTVSRYSQGIAGTLSFITHILEHLKSLLVWHELQIALEVYAFPYLVGTLIYLVTAKGFLNFLFRRRIDQVVHCHVQVVPEIL